MEHMLRVPVETLILRTIDSLKSEEIDPNSEYDDPALDPQRIRHPLFQVQ